MKKLIIYFGLISSSLALADPITTLTREVGSSSINTTLSCHSRYEGAYSEKAELLIDMLHHTARLRFLDGTDERIEYFYKLNVLDQFKAAHDRIGFHLVGEMTGLKGQDLTLIRSGKFQFITTEAMRPGEFHLSSTWNASAKIVVGTQPKGDPNGFFNFALDCKTLNSSNRFEP